MRRPPGLAAAALAVAVASIAATAGIALASAPSTTDGNAKTNTGATVAATAPPTTRVVVRPVTADGHARSGFAVSAGDGTVDCSYPDPSPGAVNRDIETCSPSYQYAVACWKSASPHRVLCMRDPTKPALAKIQRTGRFAGSGLAPRSQRAPLLLQLRDGTRCSIRDGGAWGSLKSHPSWYGTYSCDRHGVVWSPPNAHHNGIDESAPSWTVRTAASDGTGRITVRHVRKAWFVGTARG